MEKIKIRYIVDLLMFICFLVVAISGFVLWGVLPKGSGKFGITWILDRHQWLWLHNWGSIVFIILIIFYLILNWDYIKFMIKHIFERKNG